MTVTLIIAWWWLPLAVTVVAVCWAVFVVDGGGGYLSGIGNIVALVPALAISAVAWAIAGALK